MVKVTGLGQRSRLNFWRTAVDIRGSALPSAAKSNNPHYQFKVYMFVCDVCNELAYAHNHADAVARLLILPDNKFTKDFLLLLIEGFI